MGMIYEYDSIDRALLFGSAVRRPVSLAKPRNTAVRVVAAETATARVLRTTNDLRKLHLLFKVQTMGKVNE